MKLHCRALEWPASSQNAANCRSATTCCRKCWICLQASGRVFPHPFWLLPYETSVLPHCRAQGWPASTGPAARMLQIADLQFQNAPKFANLQPYETSLQSPGPWNGQPAARMIPMHICINLLQDVLDMPARVFLPSILDSDMCYLTAEPWNGQPAASMLQIAYLQQLIAGSDGYACKGLLPSILASAM